MICYKCKEIAIDFHLCDNGSSICYNCIDKSNYKSIDKSLKCNWCY